MQKPEESQTYFDTMVYPEPMAVAPSLRTRPVAWANVPHEGIVPAAGGVMLVASAERKLESPQNTVALEEVTATLGDNADHLAGATQAARRGS